MRSAYPHIANIRCTDTHVDGRLRGHERGGGSPVASGDDDKNERDENLVGTKSC